jgi:hypothetical protein
MTDNEANPQRDLDYQFTTNGPKVTAMQTVLGGQTHDVKLPSNATFNVGATTVTETLSDKNSTTVIVYAQDAGSSTLYDKADVTTTFLHPSTDKGGYSFTIGAGGGVTAMQHVETEHGHSHTENVHLPLDAVFTAATNTVTEQFVRGNEVETITFTQPTGSSLYAVQSVEKTYIDGGAATTFLDVAPKDRMEFTIDGSGNVTQAQNLDMQGGLHTVSNPHVSFTQLAPGYVEKLTTHGSETSYEVYYAGQAANGVYAEVAHGAGSTVDLAGLQAQVTSAEQSLLTGATPASPTGWII